SRSRWRASRSSRRSSSSSSPSGSWSAASRRVAFVAEDGIRLADQLPYPGATIVRSYGLMAESLRFETNDAALLAAADASFGRFPMPTDDRDPLVLRLFSQPLPSGA